jgi:Xaa-Pro dipeptidase
MSTISCSHFSSRWRAIAIAAGREGIARTFIADPLNFAYATGHRSREFDKRFRVLLLVIDQSGRANCLAPQIESEVLRSNCPELGVQLYDDDSAQTAVATFVQTSAKDTLGDLGIESGFLDRPCLPRQYYSSLGSIGRLADVSNALLQCRMMKDARERDCLVRAAEISQAAWMKALQQFFTGMRLADARNILAAELCLAGTDFNFPGHIELRNASRPRAATIEKGEVLWGDFGASYLGYQADISRRAVFGKSTSEQAVAHARAHRLLSQLVDLVRPGKPCHVIVREWLDRFSNIAGGAFPPTGRIGHGLGLSAAEPPSLSLGDVTILEPGMVLTPEPSFFTAAGEFVHLEEMIIVTETGAEFLSDGAQPLYETS